MIRVGFDFTSGAWQQAGIGRATRGLLEALINRNSGFDYLPFYPGFRAAPQANQFFRQEPIRCRRIPVSERLWLALSQRMGVPMPMKGILGQFDIYHGPDFIIPASASMCSIVTIHDLTYVTHPDSAHPAQKRYLDSAVPQAIARSSRVIAVSESTRDDVIAIYGVRSDRVHVVHNGLDPIFRETLSEESLLQARRVIGPISRFVFSVGTIQPRKNFVAMAKAVGLARRCGIDIEFVLAGATGWRSKQILSDIAELDDGFVHFVGPVNDMVLKGLYQLADVTMVVSKAEGFMLPIIESMAMGTPVITSDVSSMPEVAGGAALLVSPSSPEQMADAIVRLVKDPALAQHFRDSGLIRAGRFTWQSGAKKTEAVYRAALGL